MPKTILTPEAIDRLVYRRDAYKQAVELTPWGQKTQRTTKVLNQRCWDCDSLPGEWCVSESEIKTGGPYKRQDFHKSRILKGLGL